MVNIKYVFFLGTIVSQSWRPKLNNDKRILENNLELEFGILKEVKSAF